jgi:hypothetical protein
VIGATDAQAEIVDQVLGAWADAAKQRPRLREIRFDQGPTPENLDRPSDYRSGVITLFADDLQDPWTVATSLHHELGHAFDDSRHPQLSLRPCWSSYASEEDPRDRPAERYAQTAGMGPDGLRLFPEPGEADCALNQSVDDAAVVREDLLRPDRLDLRSPAPVTRTILLPPGSSLPSVFAIGEEGIGFQIWSDFADYSPDLLVPDLDEPDVTFQLDPTRWPGLQYDPSERLDPLDVPRTWAAGIGRALENPTPIGDGSTQISSVKMDTTQANLDKIDLTLVLETDVLTGEVLAVHDTWCQDAWSRSWGTNPPMAFTTSDGVWLVHFSGEQITMRFFPRGDTPKPTERWSVHFDPATAVRER